MSKIILLPIEPLEERYSADWLQWWDDALGFEDIIINPKPLTTSIVNGAFLDVCGTNYYKSLQIAACCRMVHEGQVEDGDTFLLLDGWFPGVESLAYMRDALGIKFKIAGCFHAGTYDPFDFLSKKHMGRWGFDLENSWFIIYDHIFLATKFHKDLILHNRCAYDRKLHVTGFPIKEFPILPVREKKNIVVFPHRLDSEKNPLQFEELVNALQPLHPTWSFVKSKDLTLSKQEYYELLHDAKIAVSFADQETWGIATLESLFLDNFIVCPNRLSYKEMYNPMFLYNTFEEAMSLVSDIIDNPQKYDSTRIEDKNKHLIKGGNAIDNILTEIKGN